MFISTEFTCSTGSVPATLAPGSAREELHSRDFGKAKLQEHGHQGWGEGAACDGGGNPIVWCVSPPFATALMKAEQTREGFVLCLPKALKTLWKIFQIKIANLLVALFQNLQNHQVSLFLLCKKGRTTSHASPTASQDSSSLPESEDKFCQQTIKVSVQESMCQRLNEHIYPNINSFYISYLLVFMAFNSSTCK